MSALESNSVVLKVEERFVYLIRDRAGGSRRHNALVRNGGANFGKQGHDRLPALSKLPDGALVVLISRAHLVDFDALLAEVAKGRLKAAIDVFPTEPVTQDHPARNLPGLILTPHRPVAVVGGRRLIGKLILDDLRAIVNGNTPSKLHCASGLDIAQLAGTGDAVQVAHMANQRR